MQVVLGKLADVNFDRLKHRPPIEVKFPQSWSSPSSPGFDTFPGPEGYKVEYQGERLPGSEKYYAATAVALLSEFRHIDTVQTYENHLYLGKAIADSDVPRANVFLTSKLHPAVILLPIKIRVPGTEYTVADTSTHQAP
jgi:hypothetical protein